MRSEAVNTKKNESKHSSPTLEIYDTTLRDGTQMAGMNLSCGDKLRIARYLDSFGIPFIEGGWPGSNPKDVEFFERVQDIEWENTVVTAFGATRRAKLAVENDPQVQTLLDAKTSVCTIFGKTWNMHVTKVLRTSLDNNLSMIEETINYLQEHDLQVFYSAEHFFDGYKADRNYALETLQSAMRGGASRLVLCDTNGGSMPWEIEKIVKTIRQTLPKAQLGIHAHNDSECGVANSLAAIRSGAYHIQGTINGYGERCGNANLCSIIANAELKLGMSCLPDAHLPQLYDLSHIVSEITNLQPDDQAAYVGRNAFVHKGGVHAAAVERHAESYEHVNPLKLGNQSRILVSELSGKANILRKAENLGIPISAEQGTVILKKIKELESQGFAYETADASFALMIARHRENYHPLFEVLDFKTMIGSKQNGDTFSEATVKVRIEDAVMHTVGEGNGPVSVLNNALRKALHPFFPHVADFQLSDYKVRILRGSDGTESITRVLINTRLAHATWTTIGASSNIIEASLQALSEGIEYGLMLNPKRQETSDSSAKQQHRPDPCRSYSS